MVCCSLWCSAQTQYEVTASTFLNIRSAADASAPVIGTIDKGGKVDVYEIADGWAKIGFDNGFAYVSADYIRKVETPVAAAAEADSPLFNFSLEGLFSADVEWMVFVIAGLSLVLFFIRKSRGEEPLEDSLYVANWILFLAVTVVELVYLALMGTRATWFCMPDTVGWLWTVINFIIFAFVVYNQFMCYFNTLADTEYNSYGSFDKRWGLYSWGGLVVGGLVSGFFFQAAVPFVLVAFVVCQLVQIVLIFKGVVPQGGWGKAFLCTAVYLLGSVATLWVLAHFVVLLIIVLVAYFLLSLLGKSSNTRRCCKNCSHYSGGYCSYRGSYVSDAYNKVCDNYS